MAALMIVWARREAERVGELCIVSEGQTACVLGRGSGTQDEPNVRFFRQRPGTLTPVAPLTTPSLSRKTLRMSPERDAVKIVRTGRCEITVNGGPTDAAELHAGDLIAVGPDLLFYCVQRPLRMPPLRLWPSAWLGEFAFADQVGMVGESAVMHDLRENLGFAAKADTHVLLLGESGTGKELAARAIHALGPSARGKFIARNASTLPSTLIDAELFGNAKNYPQAGMGERAGLIGDADGGTLFLDEIGELPNEHQAHLLRVLDSGGEYQRLGESQVRRSNFRLVAATNRSRDSLKHDFAARFTAEVRVPALADRREDIPLIIRALLIAAAERSPEIAGRFITSTTSGARLPKLSRELVQELLVRTYPTNIRELAAILWQALRSSEGDELELPPTFERSTQDREQRGVAAKHSSPEPTADEIRSALRENGDNIPAAARALGLSSRFVLNRLLKKHGIR